MDIEAGQELLKVVKECQQEAGIYEHCFISFGTALGGVRPTIRRYHKSKPYFTRGFMEHDGDSDMGILGDRITPEQRENYYEICKSKGLMNNWAVPDKRRVRRPDTNEYLWFSLKAKKGGPKMCQWFFWDFKGYSWHGKGRKWLSPRKFSTLQFPREGTAQGLALGAPAKYFKELIEIDFEGMKHHVPLCIGSLIDFWYPGWYQPKKGGASAKKMVLVINDWTKQSSWRIL